MMKQVLRRGKKIITTILAIGIAFSTAHIAQAATATFVPYSYGSIEGGYYRGSRNVQYAYSYITMYSFSTSSYCEAHQSGNGQAAYMKVGVGQTCEASQKGTMTTASDYAKYIVG